MTITSATSLSADPKMREREIQALKDQIASLRTQADDLVDFGLYNAAAQSDAHASRLQRRLDELEPSK